jgi:hypothetical protein
MIKGLHKNEDVIFGNICAPDTGAHNIESRSH